MNVARKRILIWVMTLVFAVTSVVGTSTVLVNAESATGPYGWTVSYADPQNDGETVKVNITFNHINEASVEIPCRLYDEDIWDSIVIAGYDKYGNYTEMDVNIDDDGCGIDGEAYMEDSEGFNSCFNVYVNKMYHEYEVINAVEATCKDYGYNEFKCSGCGDVFRQGDTGYLDYLKWG